MTIVTINLKKYTFKDWWNGDFCLIYCPTFSNAKDEIIRVDWEDIESNDVSKIKTRQKGLFEQQVKRLTESWESYFTEGYVNSEMKQEFLDDEISDFYNVLFKTSEYNKNYESYRLRNHELYFTANYLFKIQKYANDIIKKGGERNYNFVHSPQFAYQDKSQIIPEVYAQACWDYHEWLKKFKPETTKAATPTQYSISIPELKKLKLKFDSLKPYSEKLKFWDKHFWDEKGFFHFYFSYFFETNDEERLKPENFMTLFPTNEEETKQFNTWLLNHIQTDKQTAYCNFENLRQNYLSNVTNNPLPIDYTEQEISEIEKQRDKEKVFKDEGRDIFFWAYYWGYQSVVNNKLTYLQIGAEDFSRIALSYVKGNADAHYLGFLRKQLIQLKNENVVLKGETKKSDEELIKLTDDRFGGTGREISDIKAKKQIFAMTFKYEYDPSSFKNNEKKYFQYFDTLRKIKPLFQQLSYEDRLIFWEKKGFDVKTESVCIVETIPYSVPKYAEREYYISITPHYSESEKYFNWIRPYLKKYTQAEHLAFFPFALDIKNLEERYFKHIKESPYAKKKFTQNELNSITDELAHDKQHYNANELMKIISTGGGASPLQQGYSYYVDGHNFPSVELYPEYTNWWWYGEVLRGITLAEYEGFLDEQLLKISRVVTAEEKSQQLYDIKEEMEIEYDNNKPLLSEQVEREKELSTEDLILRVDFCENEVARRKRIVNVQINLAGRGLSNVLAHEETQLTKAEFRLLRLKRELKVRETLGVKNRVRLEGNNIQDFSNKLKEKAPQPVNPENDKRKTKQLISYTWDTKKFTALTDLHTAMKGKLIDSSSKDFKAVFSSNPVTALTPIKWHDGNATELLYFIIQLQEKTYILKEKRMNYERLKKCFVKNDGSAFNESFKELKQSLKQNLVETLSSDKTKLIDKILKNLSS